MSAESARASPNADAAGRPAPLDRLAAGFLLLAAGRREPGAVDRDPGRRACGRFSRVTESSTQHFVLRPDAVPPAMALFAPALFWLNGLYLRTIGALRPERTTRSAAGAPAARSSSSSMRRHGDRLRRRCSPGSSSSRSTRPTRLVAGLAELNTRRRRGRAEALRGRRPRCRAGRDRRGRAPRAGRRARAARSRPPRPPARRRRASPHAPRSSGARMDEAGAQRQPHQDVVGAHLPALGVVDLEPAAPGADLREQERLLGAAGRRRPRSAPGAPAARRCRPVGRRMRPAAPRLPPVVALQPGGRSRHSAARRSGSATVSPPIRNSSATRSGVTSLRRAAVSRPRRRRAA